MITGASSGIGRALAIEFGRRGADVAVLARRADRLEDTAVAVRAAGGRALPVVTDVSREGDLDRAVAAVHAAFGAIDIAVANAGFGVSGNFSDLGVEDYRRQFDTNVFGVLRTARAALPDLAARRGSLVLLGSAAAYVAAPGQSAYCMSKFAIRALAGSLRAELAPTGVAVVLVTPGYVASEIRLIDRHGVVHPDRPDPVPGWLVMPAERAARRIVAAILRRRREVVITGHARLLILLCHVAPWLVRALAARPRLRRGQRV